MGFSQGLSGLKASSTSLDVIGNNIANASTVGFKASTAQFADIYSQSMYSAAANQVGIGAMVTRVQQCFTQGNIEVTNNSLDVAINGTGLFRFSDNGAIVYSRNGQLELTPEGYLVNAAGHRLTGYPVGENDMIAVGVPVELQIKHEDAEPKVTSKVTMVMNLDAREELPTLTPFDPNNPLTYNQATAIDVYDSLGNMHVLQTFYVKTSAIDVKPATWAVYAYVDGNVVNTSIPPVAIELPDGSWTEAPLGTLTFDEFGKSVGDVVLNGLKIPGINGAADITLEIDYTGTTQFGANFGITDNQQDGFTAGRLQSFSVDDYGYILGQYTNGRTKQLGQIVLTTFRNLNGLAPIGDNEWVETMESGAPITGTPLTGLLGTVQSYAVEESNTDLTEQLVDMIIAQRVYQANAETISTQDQIMQTLINIR